jgi:hypothetical protein
VAYCLLPDYAHLAIELGTVPAATLLHDLTQHYSRSMWDRRGERIIFRRHRILLVDPEYRCQLVRFVHRRTVEGDCIQLSNDYSHSSHRAYLGADAQPLVDTIPLLRDFNPRLDVARREYAIFVSQPPPWSQVRGFEHGLRRESRVFATPGYLRRIGLNAGLGLAHSLDTVVETIQRYRGITRDELMQSRSCSMDRALVAWYAEERKIATLCQVAHYFGKHHSTLRWGITRYRELFPEVFNLQNVHRFTTLLSCRPRTDKN